jgi:hypothetical protein
MGVIVHLNSVFANEIPDVMQKRMDEAFGVDGKDFWQNFFLCGKCHPEDEVIYLFTEYQLKILYEYWKKKYKDLGAEVRKKMDFTKQMLLNEYADTPSTEKTVSKAKSRFCYIKHSDFMHNPELVKIGFYKSSDAKEEAKKRVNPGRDFFDGNFNGKPIIVEKDSEQRQRKEFVDKLLLTRPKIEKIFIKLEITGVKWIHYLGNEVYKSRFIYYCNKDTGCPLAAKLYPTPSTPVGI